MKKFYIVIGLLASIATIHESATADVSQSCEAGWLGNADVWYSDCWIWVQSEPQIVGALNIEVHNLTSAEIYQNGQLIASESANANAYDTVTHQELSPGVWVMHANASARVTALKWSDFPTNSQGVTYNPLCARGKYSYYQAGTGWIYIPGLDFEDCSYNLSTE